MRLTRTVVAIAATLASVACGTSGGTSVTPKTPATTATTPNGNSAGGSATCLELVNGTPTANYPGVVRLMSAHGNQLGICSGTFISQTAVLTAAHCIDNSATGGMYLVPGTTVNFNGGNPMLGAVSATMALTRGSVGDSLDPGDPAAVAKDTAILLFPAGHAPSIVGLGGAAPATGSIVTSVGFGLTSYLDAPQDPKYDASKHSGSMAVAASADGINVFVGGYTANESAAAAGAKAINSFGDSGGPMLLNNNLVGTLSNGGDAQNKAGIESYFSVFVDVNSSNTKALIAMANMAGAAIPPPGTLPPAAAPASSGATATNNAAVATCAAK